GFGRAGRGKVVIEDGGAGDPASLFGFLADPRVVAVTRALARRHRLGIGSPLVLIAGSTPVLFRVRTILESEELEQAFGGNLVLMDLKVAQSQFNRPGRLDRIDLRVPEAE